MPQVILWTQNDCPLCERVKAYYGAGNYTEKNVLELVSGDEPNDEAMAQLAMQDMQLPLIQIGETFADVNEILAKAESDAA